MNYEETLRYLESLHQEQLLKYYDELNEEEQASLLSQIEQIDFSLLKLLEAGADPDVKRGTFAPLSALTIDEIRANEAHYRAVGLEALRRQKTAAVLLAGGQGTRLGFDKPKGMFNIGKTHD
ncbi:MAG: UTP--glucose-1-phosphate uridylyltransferase, partial [Lachnospiraceae bacterium]|nr:UTP--glucose-1-phosphate uridylyltransferase [Lachnospiraceae bacterium]